MQRDNFSCSYCTDSKNTLNVHHKMYLGKNPWDTPNECLVTLCEYCHGFEHELEKYSELEVWLFECVRNRDSGNKEFYKEFIEVVRRLKNNG